MGYTDNDQALYNGYGGMDPKPSEENSSSDLMMWVKLFLHYWYLFLIAVVVAVGIAFVKNCSWMPQYNTEAQVIIEPGMSSSQFSFMQGFGGTVDYTHTNNQLLIIGSYDIINRAISKLNFGVDYYVTDNFKTYNLYGREPVRIVTKYVADEAYAYQFRFVPVDDVSFRIILDDKYSRDAYPGFVINGKYGEPIESPLFFGTVEKLYLPANNKEFLFRFRSVLSLEEEFVRRLGLRYVGSTRDLSTVLSVSLVGNACARDRDFINALCSEYLASNLEEKNEEAARTIEFINQQLAFIADSLHISEARLQSYRREHNMVDISGYTSGVLSKLHSLDTRRAELNLKDKYFDELSEYLHSTVTEEKLVAPSSIGVSDPVLLDLVNRFNEIQQRRSEFGEKNPNYERYSKKLAEVRETMIEVLANVRTIHGLERKAFEEEYSQVMRDMQNLPEQELTMLTYERSYKINDNYYTFLLQKQSEAQIRKASNVPDNKILQKARTGAYPVNGDAKMKIYLIFMFVAVLLVAGVIVLRELFSTTIRSTADIVAITDRPVIGEIRHTKGTRKVMSIVNTRSVFSEGFRIVRSRIEFITQRKSRVSIMVSSAGSGDGKSHFSANLAGIYKMLGKKVLLIDMDMRNPVLSRKMGYEKCRGLVHLLIGENTFDELVVKNDEELGFDFLPLGVVPPNPSELMRSDNMKSLYDELMDKYDFVIIDTSPLGLVDDAYALVNLVDINLMITRAFKTNKTLFKSFVRQIEQDQVPNVYMVINDIPNPRKHLYGKYYGGRNAYYYHYYHNESSKYYTDDETSDKA